MDQFTLKELRNVYLMPKSDVKIGERVYPANEVLVSFEKIQIAHFQTLKNWASANGGFDNRAHVMWEDDKGVAIDFTQGVMNNIQFALVTGSKYREIADQTKLKNIKRYFLIDTSSQYLDLLSESEWTILLPDKAELKENLVVKDKSGNEIEVLSAKTEDVGYRITIPETEDTDYFPLIVTYDDVVHSSVEYTFGLPLKQTFYSLQATTKFVDDKTGEKEQQLIEIPKLQITSDLKMNIGDKANPVAGSFSGIALPVGDRTHKEVMTMSNIPDSVAFM